LKAGTTKADEEEAEIETKTGTTIGTATEIPAAPVLLEAAKTRMTIGAAVHLSAEIRKMLTSGTLAGPAGTMMTRAGAKAKTKATGGTISEKEEMGSKQPSALSKAGQRKEGSQ